MPGKTPKELTLVFTVEEGQRYQMGNVTWTGNRVVSNATLQRIWFPHAGEAYDQSKIQKAQGGAHAEYAEVGYLYPASSPAKRYRATP
jgi:outer membrane protein assembly factor BamA